MRNIISLSVILLSVFILAACNTQQLVPSPTVAATQTPFIIMITTTPEPTAFPTQTAIPTSTTTPTRTPQPTQSIYDLCSLRTDWPTYKVKVGDTLSNIAVRTNATVTMLQLANCIVDRNIIHVGQNLYVPQLPQSDVNVQDLILAFGLNVTEASVGDMIIFSWTAEEGTIVDIKDVTDDNAVIASNLSATGSLTYALPADLGDLTQLEFVMNGVKTTNDGDILAEPLSVFLDLVAPEPEATEEPEVTDLPETTEQPELTDLPETTEQPELTEVPQTTQEPEATEEAN